MIGLWLSSAWAFLKRVPWQIYAGGVALLLGVGAYCAGDSNGYARRHAEQLEIERKALEKARGADAVAGETVKQSTDEVEQENDEAREAASGSDDPLKSGLDSLRTRTPRSRPSAR